jgi:hypothetical protein
MAPRWWMKYPWGVVGPIFLGTEWSPGFPQNDTHQRASADDSPFETDLAAGSVACDCSSKPLRGGHYPSVFSSVLPVLLGRATRSTVQRTAAVFPPSPWLARLAEFSVGVSGHGYEAVARISSWFVTTQYSPYLSARSSQEHSSLATRAEDAGRPATGGTRRANARILPAQRPQVRSMAQASPRPSLGERSAALSTLHQERPAVGRQLVASGLCGHQVLLHAHLRARMGDLTKTARASPIETSRRPVGPGSRSTTRRHS